MTKAAHLHAHATALVLGECGVLIEGEAGSGKSSVAAALLGSAAAMGRLGRLVGDDRLDLSVAHDRLIARPHPAIAGLIEHRGVGLLRVDYEPACVLSLVVRLVTRSEGLARLPDDPPTWCCLGVTLPLLPLPAAAGARDNAIRIAEAVARQAGYACLQCFQ